MPTEAEMLKAVLTLPDDPAPRLEYARWWSGQTDPVLKGRGEFVQVQLSLAGDASGLPHDQRYMLWSQEEALLERFRLGWDAPLRALIDHSQYYRGFVELVGLSAARWLERGESLLALAPIRHLDLRGVPAVAETLFQSPLLAGVRSLSMERDGIGDAELRQLALCPHLAELRWLSLAGNRIGLEGIEALAQSPWLKKLRWTNFFQNRVDPCERYSYDNDAIIDRWLPEEGVALELRFGELPWLHGAGDTLRTWQPNRF